MQQLCEQTKRRRLSCKTTSASAHATLPQCRYLRNITIPAAFVTRTDGDALKALIKPSRSDKHPRVMVSMDWTDLLPRSEIVSHAAHTQANAHVCKPRSQKLRPSC